MIECLVDNECKHRLSFTGDADGEDVIKALKREKVLNETFACVDMPHHGSDKNSPQYFLSNIKYWSQCKFKWKEIWTPR